MLMVYLKLTYSFSVEHQCAFSWQSAFTITFFFFHFDLAVRQHTSQQTSSANQLVFDQELALTYRAGCTDRDTRQPTSLSSDLAICMGWVPSHIHWEKVKWIEILKDFTTGDELKWQNGQRAMKSFTVRGRRQSEGQGVLVRWDLGSGGEVCVGKGLDLEELSAGAEGWRGAED